MVFACVFNHYLGINEEYDTVNESIDLDNLSDIKKYCNDIVCLYSDNNPYVKYAVEKKFADYIEISNYIYQKKESILRLFHTFHVLDPRR